MQIFHSLLQLLAFIIFPQEKNHGWDLKHFLYKINGIKIRGEWIFLANVSFASQISLLRKRFRNEQMCLSPDRGFNDVSNGAQICPACHQKSTLSKISIWVQTLLIKFTKSWWPPQSTFIHEFMSFTSWIYFKQFEEKRLRLELWKSNIWATPFRCGIAYF